VELKNLLSGEIKQGTEILAVAPQGKEDLLLMADRVVEADSIPSDILLLADPELRVINRYGLFNPEGAGDGRYQVPHPATFVIDREGVVRFALADEDFYVRPAAEDVLAALEAAH
jgi:peroxiredoxin